MNNTLNISGTEFNYYFVCHRKLWLFSHNIQCEHQSEDVALGKLLHEQSYNSKKKEFQFEGIKVDWLDLKNKVIHEVKKSDKVENAHIWQLKFYLYYFKMRNLGDFTGMLNYPKLKKTEEVRLSDSDIAEIEANIARIHEIIQLAEPPKIEKIMKICKSCSYYELCWV